MTLYVSDEESDGVKVAPEDAASLMILTFFWHLVPDKQAAVQHLDERYPKLGLKQKIMNVE